MSELSLRARTATFWLWGGDIGPSDGVLGGGSTDTGGGSTAPGGIDTSVQMGDFLFYTAGSVAGGTVKSPGTPMGDFTFVTQVSAQSGDPYFANVVLLLDCEGSDGDTSIPDLSNFARTGTGGTDIKLSTTRSKYGSSSLKVTSREPTGLAFGAHADFSRTNNQPWTMECWVYVVNSENFTSAPVLIYWADNNAVSDAFSVYGNTPQLDISTSGTGEPSPTTISKNVWVHVASTFDGTNETFWVDGVSIGLFARSIGASATGTLYVGGFTGSVATDTTEVYIDEVRVTLGVARYTATFTPPAAAFPSF
jgi:hypothetical protein